jgi:hypothetical protein
MRTMSNHREERSGAVDSPGKGSSALLLIDPACHCHTQFGTLPVMSRAAVAYDSTIARTIRFPAALRDRLAADADRCGRSLEGQGIAVLRRHYGEGVDIAPGPPHILTLASASLADVPASGLRLLTRKLRETER